MAKTQRSVKTVLHTTSETKLEYGMKKSMSGYEHDAERKEYIWMVYMCTMFWIMINLCKSMLDSKSHAITQTIHTNLVIGWFWTLQDSTKSFSVIYPQQQNRVILDFVGFYGNGFSLIHPQRQNRVICNFIGFCWVVLQLDTSAVEKLGQFGI